MEVAFKGLNQTELCRHILTYVLKLLKFYSQTFRLLQPYK
jgi:hypothetical protein